MISGEPRHVTTSKNDIRLVGLGDFYELGLHHFHGLVNSKFHLIRVTEKRSRLGMEEIIRWSRTIYGIISCSVT